MNSCALAHGGLAAQEQGSIVEHVTVLSLNHQTLAPHRESETGFPSGRTLARAAIAPCNALASPTTTPILARKLAARLCVDLTGKE